MTTRAAIYLRVSTEDQIEGFGLDAQLDRCQAMARVKSWDVAKTFRDEGISGTLGVLKRPGLRAMIAAASAGAIDAVIVAALDRLGRKTAIILSLAEQLKSLGVELVSCRENLDTSTATGQFVLTMFAGLAQLDKDNIAERLQGGIIASVRARNVTTGARAPYGYDRVKKGKRRTLAINEQEAAIVRYMFQAVASGEHSINSLAGWLDAHTIATPTNGKGPGTGNGWSSGTLGTILSNETYTGKWYYRKTKRVERRPEEAIGMKTTHKIVPRPRSEWLMVEVPAIISEELFELVQKRREDNRAQMGRQRRRTYALGGMLKCASCGIGIVGNTSKSHGYQYQYYICNARHNRKRFNRNRACETPPIRVDELDATVWAWVKAILLEPERLREQWEKHQEERRRELEPLSHSIAASEAELERLTEEKQRLIRAYMAGALSLDDIAEEKPAWNGE